MLLNVLGMKHTCSVDYLLDKNATHSGWLKRIKDGPFGKSAKRKYAVIHEGLFYLFDDDESLSTNDVIPLSLYKLNILERTDITKWGFSLEKAGSEKEAREVVTFTVGSEREQKDWIQELENWKFHTPVSNSSQNEYISGVDDSRIIKPKVPMKPPNIGREKMPLPPTDMEYAVNENAPSLIRKRLPLPPGLKKEIPSPESEDFYTDPNIETSHDFTDKFLPPTVFKWNLDRYGAKQLLEDCGTPGVYIIRKGKDQGDVISAFLLGEARHYKIFVDQDEMFLKSDHPKFRKHVDLIMYYHLNNLPTCHARLEKPYS